MSNIISIKIDPNLQSSTNRIILNLSKRLLEFEKKILIPLIGEIYTKSMFHYSYLKLITKFISLSNRHISSRQEFYYICQMIMVIKNYILIILFSNFEFKYIFIFLI